MACVRLLNALGGVVLVSLVGFGALAEEASSDDTKSTSSSSTTSEGSPDSSAQPLPSAQILPPGEEVVIYGRALQQIGSSKAASEGTVGYADLTLRPLLRVGELAEAVPGLIATQHSGGGKANQYFLRGFNLDHGTDFSVSLDGVPINMRTHAHGQGYLDLNFLIPEVIERIDYSKGTYKADVGDFSAAGSARFKTYDSVEYPRAEVTIAGDGYRRVVALGSTMITTDDSILAAASYNGNNGPWVLPEHLRKYSGFLKLTHYGSDFTTHVSLIGFDNTWNATDQVPLRAVKEGLITRFGYIDPDLGGHTSRYGISVEAENKDTTIVAYLHRYHFNLFSNSTYFLDNPVRGDEIEQHDRRWIAGFKIERDWQGVMVAGLATNFRAGIETRADFIGSANLYHTEARQRFSTVLDDSAKEYSAEPWGEMETYLTDNLRVVLGLRGSYYNAHVKSLLAANSGTVHDFMLQPKATVAWLVIPKVELYASAGRGFHSNDTRGVATHVDPVSGDPATPAPFLVKANGAEVGARFDPLDGLKMTVAAYYLQLGSELIYVGDAGTSEPSSGSRRYGVEGTMFWSPAGWITLDGEIALTHSRFRLPTGQPNHIPQSIPFMYSGGAVIDLPENVTWSTRIRHFSPTPLIEDNSVRSHNTTLVNSEVIWTVSRFRLTLGLYNVFNVHDDDIEYYFASQLAGEPAPVEDIHFHPMEPRRMRVSVQARF